MHVCCRYPEFIMVNASYLPKAFPALNPVYAAGSLPEMQGIKGADILG